MALLNILQYPDERLHTVAKPVEKIDARIKTLIADMFETMYEARGIGLAATQVDVHERVVVMDLSEERNEPRVFINPVITHKNGETTYEEGCLSVPGIYDTVTRAETVTVEVPKRKRRKIHPRSRRPLGHLRAARTRSPDGHRVCRTPLPAQTRPHPHQTEKTPAAEHVKRQQAV